MHLTAVANAASHAALGRIQARIGHIEREHCLRICVVQQQTCLRHDLCLCLQALLFEPCARLAHDFADDALPRRAVRPHAHRLAGCITHRRGEVQGEPASAKVLRHQRVLDQVTVVRVTRCDLPTDGRLEPLFAAHTAAKERRRIERSAIRTHAVGCDDLAFSIRNNHQVVDAVRLRVEVGRGAHLLWRAMRHRVEGKGLHIAIALEQVAIDLLHRRLGLGAQAIACVVLQRIARLEVGDHAYDRQGN